MQRFVAKERVARVRDALGTAQSYADKMTQNHEQGLRQLLLGSLATQWSCLLVMMFAYALITDRLTLKMVPDSPSYIEYPFESLDAAFRSIRTPAYPVMVRLVTATFGVVAIPLMQLVLHATAAFLLIRELQRWGTSNAVTWAVGLAVALGCTFVDNVSILSTDCAAASVGVVTVAMLMRWIRLARQWSAALPVIVMCVLAIAIRPAYLAIIPWIAIAGTVITFPEQPESRQLSWFKRAVLAVGLSVLCFVPIVGWMSLRGVVVGDFGLLPFGHQNLAGITIQLASDDELLAGKSETRDLAAAIVDRKNILLESEPWLALGDAGATMTIENRWDSYVWHAIVPAAASIHGRDTIANHRAIAALNRDIINRYPLRYCRWLVLAARRAVWGSAANILMQPIFLMGLLVVVSLQLWKVLRGAPRDMSGQDAGLDALFLVAVSYFICMAGFVILTSPPLGRFADAAAIFIPAWIAGRLTLHFLRPRAIDMV